MAHEGLSAHDTFLMMKAWLLGISSLHSTSMREAEVDWVARGLLLYCPMIGHNDGGSSDPAILALLLDWMSRNELPSKSVIAAVVLQQAFSDMAIWLMTSSMNIIEDQHSQSRRNMDLLATAIKFMIACLNFVDPKMIPTTVMHPDITIHQRVLGQQGGHPSKSRGLCSKDRWQVDSIGTSLD